MAIRDDPSVQVIGGNLDAALRVLKKRCVELGSFKRLKLRQQFPSVQGRRRYKRLRAEARKRMLMKGFRNDFR